MNSTRSLIQWLETEVRAWGFDPQRLEMERWREIYGQRLYKLDTIQQIRKEIQHAEASERIRRLSQG